MFIVKKLFLGAMFALLMFVGSLTSAQAQVDTDKCGILPAFSADVNYALPIQTIITGGQNYRLGSFRIRSGRNEARDLYSITLRADFLFALRVQNLTVKIDGVSQNFTISDPQGGTQYTFTPQSGAIRIAPCAYKTVDVFADVLSGTIPGAYRLVSLVDAIGTGATSLSNQTLVHTDTNLAVSAANPVPGQVFVVVGNGSATLMSLFSTQNGTPGKEVRLGQWIIAASNAENVRVDVVRITITNPGGEQCPGVEGVRLSIQSRAETVLSNIFSLALSGSSYTSDIFFVGGGALIPKNTQSLITAYGVVRQDCKVSRILTKITTPGTDIRAFGIQSNALLPVYGESPSIGGIVNIQ